MRQFSFLFLILTYDLFIIYKLLVCDLDLNDVENLFSVFLPLVRTVCNCIDENSFIGISHGNTIYKIVFLFFSFFFYTLFHMLVLYLKLLPLSHYIY